MSKTGLYIHIPFCRNKCFYCSFIVTIGQKNHIDDYIFFLQEEMKLYKGAEIASIYFGGGTPSQLSPENFILLMKAIRKIFFVSDDAEITVEMNPEDVTIEKLKCYQGCGVNRLSLGVQTFQNYYLKMLGRCHDGDQALQAYELIRKYGFDNVSVDLMYGFPGQRLEEIDADVRYLKDLASNHVSLYSLTIDPGSKFFVHGVALPDQEQMADQYVHVRASLLDLGYQHYEVSNFSKVGKQSVHNLNYWQGGNYIGLGIGAHSHVDGRRWWNIAKVREYIECIQSGVSVEDGHEQLTQQQRLAEVLVFGLRMLDGVDIVELQKKFICFSQDAMSKIKRFIEEGFIEQDGDKIKVTLKGLLVLDSISEKLI